MDPDWDSASFSPGTIKCLLCKDVVEYKDGDRTNFTNHVKNVHNAKFHHNLILAITFFDNNNLNNIIEQFERTVDALTFTASDEVMIREDEEEEEDIKDFEDSIDANKSLDDGEENDDGYTSFEFVGRTGSFEVIGENNAANETFDVLGESSDEKKLIGEVDVAALAAKNRVHSCELCDKTFTNRAALNMHTRKNHQHGEKRKEVDDDEINPVDIPSAKIPKITVEPSSEDISKSSKLDDSADKQSKSSLVPNLTSTGNSKAVDYEYIIGNSDYFRKHPKQITSKTNTSLHSMGMFPLVDPDLPPGWKLREHKRPDGDEEKHYLSPDGRVVKSKAGALEYVEVLGKFAEELEKDVGEDMEVDPHDGSILNEGNKNKTLYEDGNDNKSSMENNKEKGGHAKSEKKGAFGKECPECFKFVRNLKTHVEDMHSPPGHFPCPRKGCGKVYTSKNKLGSHFSRNCKNRK